MPTKKPWVFNLLAMISFILVIADSPAVFAAGVGKCERQFQVVPPAAETVQRYSMKPSLVNAKNVLPSARYHSALKAVAQLVAKLRPSSKITETVLYPFAGFDFSAPMILFPKAKTYIMIDRNSVIDAYQIDQLRKAKLDIYGTDHNRGWVIWSQTGHTVFQNILKSLFSVSPNSKIEKIEFIVDDFQQVSLELRFIDGRNGERKTLHYWAGMAAPVPPEMNQTEVKNRNGTNWWHDTLLALKPRTLLLKGSHSLLRVTNFNYSPTSMRDVLTSGIRENGGLVVEGASDMAAVFDADWVKKRSSGLNADRSRWELTDGDPQFSAPLREVFLDGIEFSYGDKVHVAIYPGK